MLGSLGTPWSKAMNDSFEKQGLVRRPRREHCAPVEQLA
jgi:hypothetical protein